MSVAEPNRPTILTKAQRKVIADLMPSLTARLKLDHVNSRTINFTADELEIFGEWSQKLWLMHPQVWFEILFRMSN